MAFISNEFLKLENTFKKHWSDFSSWEIMEHLHNQVLASIKAIIQGARFVALTYYFG
jgi:hypothetical protein